MKIIASIMLVLLITGCSHQTFIVSDAYKDDHKKEVMQPFFIGGIGQSQEMDAATICGAPEKVAKVETYQSFLNGLLGGLTWGIYTPLQAKVYCVE